MKAAVIFAGSGPILVLTSLPALDDPGLVSRLAGKGIRKFIAYEIPLDDVRGWYGPTFDRALSDIHQEDELRIVDVDGVHIFGHLHLDQLGRAVRWEPEMAETGS